MVSDGSFFQSSQQSVAAFILGNEAAHRRIIGRCHIIGPTSAHSAYRAELAGLHGGLTFLSALCKIHQLNSGHIIVACDNKGALQRIVRGNIKPQGKNFDYLSAIVNIVDELPIKISFTHVEGHRDRHTTLDNLTVLESMIVQADIHARIKASIPTPAEILRLNTVRSAHIFSTIRHN